MIEKKVNFRPVQADDADMVLAWRNDKITRDNSRRKAFVTKPASEWLEAFAKEQPTRVMYIALYEEEPVGLVYADEAQDGLYEISYIVSPDWRGKGLGILMVKSFVSRYLRGKQLKAFIFEGNTPSEKIALAIGLRAVGHSLSGNRVLVEWRS